MFSGTSLPSHQGSSTSLTAASSSLDIDPEAKAGGSSDRWLKLQVLPSAQTISDYTNGCWVVFPPAGDDKGAALPARGLRTKWRVLQPAGQIHFFCGFRLALR